MRLEDTKLHGTYYHHGRRQVVDLITCDPIDGACLIVEPRDECGDIMGGDLFRCEAYELLPIDRKLWESVYPPEDPDNWDFDAMFNFETEQRNEFLPTMGKTPNQLIHAALRWMQYFVLSVLCPFRGHPCYMTGRHGHKLLEWKCARCSRRFVTHSDHPTTVVPANGGSDEIFEYHAEIDQQNHY